MLCGCKRLNSSSFTDSILIVGNAVIVGLYHPSKICCWYLQSFFLKRAIPHDKLELKCCKMLHIDQKLLESQYSCQVFMYNYAINFACRDPKRPVANDVNTEFHLARIRLPYFMVQVCRHFRLIAPETMINQQHRHVAVSKISWCHLRTSVQKDIGLSHTGLPFLLEFVVYQFSDKTTCRWK